MSLTLPKPVSKLSAAFATALVLGFAAGCTAPKPSEPPRAERRDPHSYARPDEVVVEHLDLDLTVDFEARRLSGTARLSIENLTGAGYLFLDTRDLEIHRVSLGDEGSAAEFTLAEPDGFLGSELAVAIEPTTKVVAIEYSAGPDAMAVQWLDPTQTAGGEHPFLFTQNQPILARTWIPCQDSPAVRMTYDAVIRVPPDLMAVMSAENLTAKSADGVYRLHMPQAIPSYLVALAVGDLEFRPLGESSGVFAEPSVVERAAWEFAETEAMMDAAARLYGPYRWGRYDILVLPPSFPFGGMENPRLTFATPTVLAGDRSLVSLVAHELAHSWSGNLVTNATWNDIWLNEGFTVYLELRIMEEVHGREHAEMLALLERRGLDEEIARLGPENPGSRLRLDLAGIDPDDGMTSVAYSKGYFFLRLVEEAVGRERFDAFLKGWFDANAFQSRATDEFVAYLRRELVNAALDEKLRVDEWVYGPGLPGNVPRVESRAFQAVEAEVASWLQGTPAAEIASGEWSTQEWQHFLASLPAEMTASQMAELDAAWKLSDAGNSEILFAWLEHVIRNRYEPAYPALERFLTGMGRLKFLEPLYEELAATDEGLVLARRIYARARAGYHPLGPDAVDPILGWPFD